MLRAAGGRSASGQLGVRPASRAPAVYRYVGCGGGSPGGGKNNRSQIDMADLKPIWIEHSRTSPDVVVLGTSRMLQIRQDWFQPRIFWNLACRRAILPTRSRFFSNAWRPGNVRDWCCWKWIPPSRSTRGRRLRQRWRRIFVARCCTTGSFRRSSSPVRYAGHVALGSASIWAPGSLGGLRQAGASRLPVTSRWKR